ncbi:hypothetical protein N9E25_06475 [Verrucomicrobiales bacterium]|nr:hypothetical protein [Verrucomicrobiales bacterium]
MKANVAIWKAAAALSMPLLMTANEVDKLDYRTDVAPLLRDYCSGCHNNFDMEGEFSVETFAALSKGGESDDKKILVPGKPAESYLLQTVLKTAKPAMPPKRETQMSQEEIDVLVRWVEEGAIGPEKGKDLSILSTLTVPDIAKTDRAAEPITAMDVSPDGKQVALARYRQIDVQDRESGKVVGVYHVDNGKVNAVHFSPDGKSLIAATGVTGLRGVAFLWNLETGVEVRRFGEGTHRDILFDAEFSPDGKQVATAGYDRIIRLWETASGKYLREFPSHNGAVFDLAFSPDGTVLASASADSTCKIWHVESGRRLDTLNQPQGEQFRVDFTPDGKYVIGAGADNRIRVWRFVSKEKPRLNPLLRARFGHEDEIVEFGISEDGKWLLTTSRDLALKQWSLPGLELAGVFPNQPDVISGISLLANGKVAAARLDGSFTYLDAKSMKLVSSRVGEKKSKKRASSTMAKPTGDMPKIVNEIEGGEATFLGVGGTARGVIGEAGDIDDFLFSANAGEQVVLEVSAARKKSELDSHIAVMDEKGNPVERAVLQAVRDSWLTFRGKDSIASTDFRVHNWREMELNEYLYLNGEVVKLWHYPRGPDSGFLVYPGFGNRHTFFGTTSLSHPLGQPCYIVRSLPVGSEPSPNGLPIYRVYYENDDDPTRDLGKDSKIIFTAPADGTYTVRVKDVRGFGGEKHHYELIARKPRPDFSISVAGKNPEISPGSGRELMFTAKRIDGYMGPIKIKIANFPEALSASDSVTIEANQFRAFTPVHLRGATKKLDAETVEKISLVASAEVGGKSVTKPLGNLGTIKVGKAPEVIVEIHPDGEHGKLADDGVLEFTIRPGETVTARVVAQRLGLKGRIDFGKEDSGRNLPHGLYVDNIGLNGLMIPDGKSEQRFFVTAAKWVPDMVREFHVRTTQDGKQSTKAVRIRVVSGEELSQVK